MNILCTSPPKRTQEIRANDHKMRESL